MASSSSAPSSSIHTYLAHPTVDYLKTNAIHMVNWFMAPANGPGNAKDYELLFKVYTGESPSTISAIKKSFEQLTPSTSEKIYYYVSKLAKPRAPDADWGERHAFDSRDRLRKAIKLFANHKFDHLDRTHKEAVANRVYQHALTNHNTAWARQHKKDWGMRHAKDSTTILLQSLGSAPNITNSEKGQKHKSSLYHLNRRELPRGQIGYINGTSQSKEKAKQEAKKISDAIGKKYNLHCVHAASNGSQDYYETILNYGGTVTPPVQLLHKSWDKFFAKSKRTNAKFLQICSSKGAIHVNVALKTYDKKLRPRIQVLAIAPAELIEKGLCGRVKHIILEEDAVPFLSPNASRIYQKNPPDPDIELLRPASQPSSYRNPLESCYRQASTQVVKNFLKDECGVGR